MSTESDPSIDQYLADRLFIQEIITDLERNGYVQGGKASDMLRDWSRELKGKAPRVKNLRRLHAELCGANNW